MADSSESLTLSVIICAYTLERWDDICRAVRSVEQQDPAPLEVILVSDRNDELLARATRELPGVVAIPNTLSPGLSGARNSGVAIARADVVAFLDDDAAAEPGWAAQLLATYRTGPQVLGVAGSVRPDWRRPRPGWFPDEFLWVVGCSYRGLPTSLAPVRNGIGANMSFRRSVFDEVGGFDANVGRFGADAAGCEETEFSIRVRQANPAGVVLMEPLAVCVHTVGPERTQRSYYRRRCSAEGRSKALVSKLAGSDAALSSEREYVRKVLPSGVVRGIGEALRGRPAGLARSWAIIEGFGLTALSYGKARLAAILRDRKSAS
jgi:glycosyltransferase involved in cell wall biosynthesis